MADRFKDRIISYGKKPADQFLHNPDNPRRHPQKQRDAVAGSLSTLGWIAPVIENQRTGYLIDGHERVWHALQNNEDVPFILVDLDPAEEKQALATFDWITYLAEYDSDVLDGLLREVNSDNADIQQLLADMAKHEGLYIDPVPSLDELEREYGEYDPATLNADTENVIAVKVSPATYQQYQRVKNERGGQDVDTLTYIIELAYETLFSAVVP